MSARTPLVLVFLVAACGGEPDGPATPDDLCKAAFAALKAKDADAFAKLGPTEDDIEDLWDKMAAAVREAEREIKDKRRKRGAEKTESERVRRKMRETFAAALEDGDGEVQLAEAEWVDVYRRRDQQAWGIKRKDFYFRVRQGGKLWRFKLNNAVLLGGRWVLTGGIRFFGEDKGD